jgi:hypothetical protein
MTYQRDSECTVKCVCIKDAPIKTNLFSVHGIIERPSGKRNHNCVHVRLNCGKSPNGRTEFDMPATEKVNVAIRRAGRSEHPNLRQHQHK